jgi:xylulokinase
VYLGIDVGTSAVKAVIADASGVPRSTASAPLAVARPRPLWSEQDPVQWWEATVAAVRTLPADDRRAVRAVGLSGQMHGATLLGADDRVLRPAILWNDGRSAEECAELEAVVPALASITGNRAMPGFTAPKLLWVRRHEPDVFRAVHRVLLPKDYLRLRLTGLAASDCSDAAGTLWMDVGRRCWSPSVLAATYLDETHMPQLVEGTEMTGALLEESAAALGLAQVPVYGGGGDNAAAAIGMGIVRDGAALLSLGTSGVLFVACDAYRPNAEGGVHTFCHAVPGRWHQMSVLLSAASSVQWAARIAGRDVESFVARVEAAATLAGSEVFLPYLSGERTPHNDPHARGVLFGITHDTTPEALGQAVMEGVALAFRDGLDALLATGTAVEAVSVAGGGARSLYWGRLLSAALERPVIYRRSADVGAALGAARLAAIGHQRLDVDSACIEPAVERVLEPERALVEHFAARLPLFRSLYRQLATSFRGMS